MIDLMAPAAARVTVGDTAVDSSSNRRIRPVPLIRIQF